MMNVSIIGRKVKITPDIRQYIEKNMKKLDHYIDHIYDFKLIIKRERHIYLAEVNINVKKKMIHIFAKTHDIFSVIDTLYDKIEVKMSRYRDRLTNRRFVPLKESAALQAEGATLPANSDEETAEVEEGDFMDRGYEEAG
jgi:ribosomal subunit interface protein